MEESRFRRKITWFQFACCVLVIWSHAGNAELFMGKLEKTHPLMQLEYGIGSSLIRVSIPCFLMVSAYLFYRNFSWDKLPGKWKRRCRTLLLPYLCWNLLYYFGYLAGSRIPVLDRIVNRPGMEFSLADMASAALFYRSNAVFWFLYQLILLTALAPVLYLFLKRIWSGLLFLGAAAVLITLRIPLPQLNLDALFYYSLAAFLAIHARKQTEGVWTPARAAAGAVLVCAGLFISQWYYRQAHVPAIVACHALSVTGLWLLVDEAWLGAPKPWMGHTFFIYAFHFIPVRFLNKTAAMLLKDSWAAEAAAAALYLCMPAAALFVCYQVSRPLERFCPRAWALLNGGR